MLAMGRCAQDTYYLVPIEEQDLPEEIKKRSERRVEDVLALKDWCLLVFFCDGAVKKCDLKSYFSDKKEFQILLKKPEYFPYVEMQVGGFSKLCIAAGDKRSRSCGAHGLLQTKCHRFDEAGKASSAQEFP